MSDHDPKLEALFKAAVKSQERLEKESTGEQPALDGETAEEIEIEVEAAAEGERKDAEIEISLEGEEAGEDDLGPPVGSDVGGGDGAGDGEGAAEAAAPTATPTAASKRSVQDALTEALLKAKQEAVEALEQTQREAKSLRDRLLRVSADFENFKKRARKQQEEAIKFANEGMLREVLPVLDNFERAVEHVDKDEQNPVIQGIQMVHGHLMQTLEKLGLQRFSAMGQAFDPTLHEAVEQKQTDEHPAGLVVGEYQRGYTFQERLLRPAMVVVAMPVPKPEAAAATAEAGDVAGTPVPAAAQAAEDAAQSGATSAAGEASAEASVQDGGPKVTEES